ncbi:hypothetical protein T01_8363 [Trichinella spiralis]|uniref:Uncharacterized protein n=1 Tax=Trichinella spiralis TaxID=6334 RepID=A0A0V1BQZ9_TRISP|nr:hypothetical protein T01_8363 [Trichinella spiralis]
MMWRSIRPKGTACDIIKTLTNQYLTGRCQFSLATSGKMQNVDRFALWTIQQISHCSLYLFLLSAFQFIFLIYRMRSAVQIGCGMWLQPCF